VEETNPFIKNLYP